MKIGSKIAQCRKRAGYSQETLAAELNISRQAISRWETGEAVPDTEKVVQLSKILGVSTDYLLLDEMDESEQRVETERSAEKSFRQTLDGMSMRQFCGIVLVVFGILVIIITAISAGLYSDKLTSWYTDYGRFGTALFHTWRVIFLYVGILIDFVGLWFLAGGWNKLKAIINGVREDEEKAKSQLNTILLIILAILILIVICY